jgi:hypothetical protein
VQEGTTHLATPESRLPLWLAMSDLFLDTEIQAYTRDAIAREIDASGLSLAEAEAVYWNEVYPALWVNLTSVAGVWDGFDAQWLLRTLKVSSASKPRRRWLPIIAKEMREEWARVIAAHQALHKV